LHTVTKHMSDDSSPVFRRRPRQTVAPKSPDSPSQGRAASGASPDSLSRPKLKLAVPPTPGSEARANERAVGRQEKEECPPTPDSDARKAARANKRAVRRQEKEERRQKREARKRESLSNRQHFLKNKFMAHQAREANDKDESVEGSSNSDDDGYFLLSFFSSFFWTSPFYFLIAQPTVIVPTSPTSRMARIIQMLP